MIQIYWRELPGNKYLKKLEPLMLTTRGCLSRQLIKPIGSKRKSEAIWVTVFYDRLYVYEKIKLEFIEPLGLNNIRSLMNLILSMWLNADGKIDADYQIIKGFLMSNEKNNLEEQTKHETKI